MNARISRLALIASAIILIPNVASAYYAAHMGRWTSRDPAFVGGQVRYNVTSILPFIPRDASEVRDGANLYQYVQSHPVVLRDPLGLAVDGPPPTAGQIARNACIRSCTNTPQERAMFDHWTDGGGDPYSIPPVDSCNIVKDSPIIQQMIDRLRDACTAGNPINDGPIKPFPAPPPYVGGIGTGNASTSSSCNGGCLTITVTITDTYDFNWGNRPRFAECATRLVSIFGTGTDYSVTGTCSFQTGNCPMIGPALPPPR